MPDNFKPQKMSRHFAGLVIYVHDSSRPLEDVHYDKEFILVSSSSQALLTDPGSDVTQRHGGELATSPVEPNVTHIVVDPAAVETKADSHAFSAPNFSTSNRRAARLTPPNWQLDDFFLIFASHDNPPFIVDTV